MLIYEILAKLPAWSGYTLKLLGPAPPFPTYPRGLARWGACPIICVYQNENRAGTLVAFCRQRKI